MILVIDRHSSSGLTMAVLQSQLWGFAWLSKDLQNCGACCSADGALCLFMVLFLEGAPVTEPFTSMDHKWPSWTPHIALRFEKKEHRLWSTAKMPGTKGKSREKNNILKWNSFIVITFYKFEYYSTLHLFTGNKSDKKSSTKVGKLVSI